MADTHAFFTQSLQDTDPVIYEAIRGELKRQQEHIELIASENIVSNAVLEAQGSVMTNKYAEGYPAKRYYGGCEYVDTVEQAAIDRACELFGCNFANVQPNSGSQANQAVFLAFAEPGDTLLGLSLDSGGHLTHGAKPNQSGKWFNFLQFEVSKDTGLLDMDAIEAMALEHKPKVIVAGLTSYPRALDFKRFREIADKVDAILMADVAHIAGLVASGVIDSPFPHCHVVTSTTHKTLRGPRGGVILSNDEEIAKKINRAIFPGMQGGPLPHVMAAKAVAFGEDLKPEFKEYGQRVLDNAKALAAALTARGIDMFTGGTDNHLIVADLRSFNVTGKAADVSLHRANLTVNKNAIPFDTESPFITSGIRIGSPAGTTRGFGEQEFTQIGYWIADVVEGLSANPDDNSEVEQKVQAQVLELCARFPIYPNL